MINKPSDSKGALPPPATVDDLDGPIYGKHPEFTTDIRRLIKTLPVDSRNGKLSLRMVGRILGISYVTIDNLIKGDRPSYETVQKIAKHFGMNTNEQNDLLQKAGYKRDQPLFSPYVYDADANTNAKAAARELTNQEKVELYTFLDAVKAAWIEARLHARQQTDG